MNKRHYEHTLPNIRGSLSNTYIRYGDSIIKKDPYFIMSLCYSEIGAGRSCTGGTIRFRNGGTFRTGIIILRQCRFPVFSE